MASLANMESFLHGADRLDYYQLLAEHPSASAVELEEAYVARMREFHPDSHRGGSLRALATRITKLLNEAHAALASPARRRLYDEGLATRPPRLRLELAVRPAVAEPAARGPTGAGTFLLQATHAERRGDFAAARTFFSLALRLEPQNLFFAAKVAELGAKLPPPPA